MHYSSLQCSAMHYSSLQCRVMQYSSLQCSAMQISSIQCSAMHYSSVQCSALHYNSLQALQGSAIKFSYSAVQYRAVQCCCFWRCHTSVSKVECERPLCVGGNVSITLSRSGLSYTLQTPSYHYYHCTNLHYSAF